MADIITDYFVKVDSTSKLINSREEEYKLLRLAKDGDEDARNQLVESNLRLVINIAKKYKHITGVNFEDLIQEGNLGLFRAIEKFDIDSGNKFSTYATWWIRQNVTRYISNHGRTVRIPIKMSEILSKANRLRDQLAFKYGREATDEEMAEALGITLKRYRDVLDSATPKLSLDQPYGESDYFEHDTSMADILSVEEQNFESDMIRRELYSDLADALEILSDEERFIIMALNGFIEDKIYTKKMIAEELGYKSTSTITKKQGEAEKKMKNYMLRVGGRDGNEEYFKAHY